MEYETMYAPLTPTHKFTEQQLNKLPKKNDIIDLSDVMDEYKEPFKEYEAQIEALKKEVTSLRSSEQKAVNLLDETQDKH